MVIKKTIFDIRGGRATDQQSSDDLSVDRPTNGIRSKSVATGRFGPVSLGFVSLLWFIIKKRVSDRKPFCPLKGRFIGWSARIWNLEFGPNRKSVRRPNFKIKICFGALKWPYLLKKKGCNGKNSNSSLEQMLFRNYVLCADRDGPDSCFLLNR